MTDKYTRDQRNFKPLAVDTPQMRAAVNLVITVKGGKTPDSASLNVLADAFLKVFGGKNPKDIFGGTLGLVPTPGAQSDYGITPADIVSAVIELEFRKLGQGRGNLAKAKRTARDAFIDIGGDVASRDRAIERDWSKGRMTVQSLSDVELIELMRPYKARQ